MREAGGKKKELRATRERKVIEQAAREATTAEATCVNDKRELVYGVNTKPHE